MPLIPLLGQLIAAGGLPVITQTLGRILSKKDGPLKEAGDILLANSSEIKSQLSSKDNMKLALAELENEKSETEGSYELLIEQQKTQRSELASSSWLARSWRPIFGLIVAGTWAIQMLACTWAIIAEPTLASGIVASFAGLQFMWVMAFGAIGVNIHQRSRDKRMQAHRDLGTTPPLSLVASIVEKFSGR